MQTNAFLRFIHDYSYPNDFYSFYSAEEETGLNSTGKNNNILIKDQSFYFLSGFSAKLIHKTLINSNFIQTNKLDEATLVVGSKSHEDLQKYLKVYQRMTHYLYTQVIGQKVGLHTTLTKFMYYTGLSLPFYPKTFLIPQQLEQFKKSVSSAKFWIEKPSCGSCGRGITIVEGMPEKFITRQVVMQEYIRNPLLIHGYKFDLRFYVAVTSLNPLRVYNYNDGLVRFATEKYALFFEDVSNLSAHLTNFSINKESENFQVTNDVKNDGKGSKWSHVPFWPFLDSLNFDVNNIKEKIDDAIATIIFSARNDLACQSNHRCSFELYGFDVLLTVDGEIHILEVNISPALGTPVQLGPHPKKE
ncbi:hypothetical protein M9Y10_041762 [Tritrichomonas musculus]|uniref:Tubulin-tyrosine ligase family protein n=1 Tax=Tritrichomonas musculus TaxID=1915356 RepID=A0ABR2K5D1_9EUKA